MADLLANATAWLEGKRHALLTRTITYRRGTRWTTLLATKGRTDFDETDQSGFTTRTHGVDWMIRSEDLILNFQHTVPVDGDKIEEQINGVTQVYQVLSGSGIPPFEWSDANRTRIRIHTKQVPA